MLRRLTLGLLLATTAVSVTLAIAPGPPQNLTATVSGNTVRFNWLSPSTGGAPGGYRLEASLSPGGTPFTSLPLSAINTMSVTGVPNGVYYIWLRATNADGISNRSNEVIVAVTGGTPGPGCSQPPNPPQSLVANVAGSLVTLTWVPPSGGCEVTSYLAQASTLAGPTPVAVVDVGLATSLSAVAPSGSYFIRVLALNGYGQSAASNAVVATVGTPCVPPTLAPMLLIPSYNGFAVTVSWVGVPGATSYKVEIDPSGTGAQPGYVVANPPFNWASPTPGTHQIRVRAMTACGEGPASNTVAVTVGSTTPTAPSSCGPTVAACGQATARCDDGSYSCSQNRSGTCSGHSGVSCWICPGLLCG